MSSSRNPGPVIWPAAARKTKWIAARDALAGLR